MHCFTGDPAQAEEALDLGFHLSFGGVLTFKTAENVRESARITPDDRLLIETDAPYLAPIPYRGKRNEPAMMLETARKLAEVRGTTPERIGELTTANFERLCLRRETRPVTLRFPMETERVRPGPFGARDFRSRARGPGTASRRRSTSNRWPRSRPSPPSAAICSRAAASVCGPRCCCFARALPAAAARPPSSWARWSK